MIRLLLVCWALAGVLVGWLRVKRSGRLSLATARSDLAATLLTGTFIWLVFLVRF